MVAVSIGLGLLRGTPGMSDVSHAYWCVERAVRLLAFSTENKLETRTETACAICYPGVRVGLDSGHRGNLNVYRY